MGLEIHQAKTRIAHTLNKMPDQREPGFDFLGFTIKQVTTKYKSARHTRKKENLGFRTLVYPTVKARKNHQLKIRSIIKETTEQKELIARLKPIITG